MFVKNWVWVIFVWLIWFWFVSKCFVCCILISSFCMIKCMVWLVVFIVFLVNSWRVVFCEEIWLIVVFGVSDLRVVVRWYWDVIRELFVGKLVVWFLFFLLIRNWVDDDFWIIRLIVVSEVLKFFFVEFLFVGCSFCCELGKCLVIFCLVFLIWWRVIFRNCWKGLIYLWFVNVWLFLISGNCGVVWFIGFVVGWRRIYVNWWRLS